MSSQRITFEIFRQDELDENIRLSLTASPDHICRKDGKCYLLSGQTVICFPDDEEIYHTVFSIFTFSGRSMPASLKKDDFFRLLLTDPYFDPDSRIKEQKDLSMPMYFRAVVFHTFSPMMTDLYSLFQAVVPSEKKDVSVPVDRQTVVFLKDARNLNDEEITEFTEAVIGTMEVEGIPGIRAGIGCAAEDCEGLRRSYGEALNALTLGMKYHGHDRVFLFSGLTLERIMDSIPEEKKKEFRGLILHKDSAYMISDEIMETVRIFFRNDLNLTAASRELFIHRNTLNYRLDKIKKEYGLDLRHFQDAVVFKLLSYIPEE